MTGFMTCSRERRKVARAIVKSTGIDLDSGNIAAVETTKGKIATRIAVNAAGAWAASVPKFAGIDLPVEPHTPHARPGLNLRRIPHTAPMIIDMSTGFHFRPEGAAFAGVE